MARTPASTTPTRVDRFVSWARNNRVVAVLIVIGIAVGGVAAFADSARKLAALASDIVGIAKGPSPADIASREQVRHTAQLIDAYFAQAISQQVLDYRPPTREQYEAMQSSLRSLVVTFTAQKQPERAKVAEAGAELLKRLSPNLVFPPDWTVEKLQMQRVEWANIFRALGHDLAAEPAPASAAKP